MSDPPPIEFDFFNAKSKDQGEAFFQTTIFSNENKEGSSKRVTKAARRQSAVYGSVPTLKDGDKSDYMNLASLAKKVFSSSTNDASEKDQDEIDQDDAIEKLMTAAKEITSSSDSQMKDSSSTQNLIESIIKLKPILIKLKDFFESIGINSKALETRPIASFFYYIEYEEERKTPSWKRRRARYLPSFDADTVHVMHDCLYWAKLAYVDTLAEIQAGVSGFIGTSSYELVYATVQGSASEPAHFICIQKETAENASTSSKRSWNPFAKNIQFLDILLVVRGTKDVDDAISDLTWDAVDYKDGKAHQGFLESGKYIVNKHTPLLKRLLEESKRDKIRISLVGHSLGAGAATIAAMEFKELDFVEDCNSIGFGAPAVVSKELSEAASDYIVSVIADSDCVPRMSEATIGNLALDIVSYDFSEKALVDIEGFMRNMARSLPFNLTDEFKKNRVESIKAKIRAKRDAAIERREAMDKARNRQRLEVILFPPGKCVHLYRDGMGVSGAYVPCTLFNELDASRSMVDDHLIDSGYNRLFHELMRGHLNDIGFQFRNRVEGLKVG